jgi:hypothetical protein
MAAAMVVVGLLLTALAVWLSPLLAVPLAAAVAAKVGRLLPKSVRDPAQPLAWLTVYVTLPAGIVGLALALGRDVVPTEFYFRFMLEVYDVAEWSDRQLWMQPIMLGPLAMVVGVLSIAFRRPEVIARLGRGLGLLSKLSLALYVLSLFTLVSSGPFKLQLGQTTDELRDRLAAALREQQTAGEFYLATRIVAATLSDGDPTIQSQFAEIVRDTAEVRRRLGCSSTSNVSCWPAPDAAMFERAMPRQDQARFTADPPMPATTDLRVLRRHLQEAEARTKAIEERQKATQETIDATVAAMTDLLPFGKLANAIAGELWEATISRYGHILAERANALAGAAPDQLEAVASQSINDIAALVRQTVIAIGATAARLGPLALLPGPEPDAKSVDDWDKVLNDVQANLKPGSSVYRELQTRASDHGYNVPGRVRPQPPEPGFHPGPRLR